MLVNLIYYPFQTIIQINSIQIQQNGQSEEEKGSIPYSLHINKAIVVFGSQIIIKKLKLFNFNRFHKGLY